MSKLTDEIKQKLKFRNALRPPSKLENLFERILRIYSIPYIKELQIDWYFADFALPEQKIIFELDDKMYHQNKEKDHKKDDFLVKKGWTVYRLTWDDVHNSDRVFDLVKLIVFDIDPTKIPEDETEQNIDYVLYPSCSECGLCHRDNFCGTRQIPTSTVE